MSCSLYEFFNTTRENLDLEMTDFHEDSHKVIYKAEQQDIGPNLDAYFKVFKGILKVYYSDWKLLFIFILSGFQQTFIIKIRVNQYVFPKIELIQKFNNVYTHVSYNLNRIKIGS